MRPPRSWPAYAALLAILAGGLALRLVSLRHGLPEVYNADERTHFTSRAIAMLGGDLNPHYFQNPSAFTYLVYGAIRALPLDGTADAFLIGRVIATVLCLAAVVAVFAAARRLWDPAAGVAAAAVLAFAFLPVAYSRFALTDTGVLLPAAVAVYGAVRAHEDGGLRWYAITGAAVGLAAGFKYTAGLVGIALLVAGLARVRRDRWRPLLGLGLSGLAAFVVFAITTPYFLLDLPEALDQLAEQSRAAGLPKLGQGETEPLPYYLRSLTWAFGIGATIAAAAGLVTEARENRMRALLLAIFPLVLLLYLLTAERAFARWLMPAYPALALLAGVGLARAAALVPEGRRVWRGVALAVLLVAALAQPALAGLHHGRTLGRDDTRVGLREHLLASLPFDARVVVEPGVPKGYFRRRLTLGFEAPPRRLVAGGTPQRFILSLEPSRIDRYREQGYCTVVTLSNVSGRARRDRVGPALAYYERLGRESEVVWRATPYRRGAEPPEFNFDWSTHLYYPRAYERPGPEIAVHRLDRCRQAAGGRPAVLAPPPGLPKPNPDSLD